MNEQATHPIVNPHHPWRVRAIGIAMATSAAIAACVAGTDGDEEELGFRAGCDGVEEYIDANGDVVYCVYTVDSGGGGGGDVCWDYPWLCDSDDDGGEAGGGEAGGGEAGGGEAGGEVEPSKPCTRSGDDCTTARRCCGSNVCGYGGERDATWCQPLEPTAWTNSCVTSRTGTPVYRNGTVCLYTNGSMTNPTCHAIEGQSCVIGYNGECGNGTYTMRLSDLVQAPPGSCAG
jgi:hypothetical protein